MLRAIAAQFAHVKRFHAILSPEEEAAEALVATLITTLVGKIFEGPG